MSACLFTCLLVHLLTCIRLLASLALSRFPTSHDEDVDLLERHSSDSSGAGPSPLLLSPNHRNAILYRLGKKKIFQHYYILATTALKLLTSRTEDSFYRVLKECQQDCHEMIVSYCSSTILPLFLHSLSPTRLSQNDSTSPPLSNYTQGVLVYSD